MAGGRKVGKSEKYRTRVCKGLDARDGNQSTERDLED